MNDNYFISVDWGTSNLRIRLVEIPSLVILEELTFSEGVKDRYNKWRSEGGNREDFFLGFLKEKIDLFKTSPHRSCSIVISGMASASIGLHELAYANLPFNSGGNSLILKRIKSDIVSNPVILISGVKSESDIIRGEEVQLVGLIESGDLARNTVFILPGTHSKHIICEKGIVTDFRTFMTGELFQVISKHTILESSISSNEPVDPDLIAFDEGVSGSVAGLSILNELFKIRVYNLFDKKTKNANFYYLSGLLIGDELKTLLKQDYDRLKLCAGGNLSELYQRAIQRLELSGKAEVISKENVDASVVKGQWYLLKNMEQ